MASADQFVIQLPHAHMLLFTVAHEGLVRAAVEKRGWGEWVNSFTKDAAFHQGLYDLLVTPTGVAFVRRWWRAHHTDKTRAKLSNTARVELVQKTCDIACDVAVALGLDPFQRVTLQTPLPKGEYHYLIEVAGYEFWKYGSVTIKLDGNSVWDTRYGRRRDDGCAVPVGFEGEFTADRSTLVHLIPGTKKQEDCKLPMGMQQVLREACIHYPAIFTNPQSEMRVGMKRPGTTEWYSRALMDRALTLMDELAEKCGPVDVPDDALEDVPDTVDLTPLQSPVPDEPVASEPPLQPTVVLADVARRLSAPGACNLMKELATASILSVGKLKEHRFLSDAQILGKVARLRQYFEDRRAF